MRVLLYFFKKILSLRYRVKIRGEECLSSEKILLLPNHVALVDPQILTAYLRTYKSFRVLTQASFFENPFLKPLFTWFGAISIDNETETMSRAWVKQASQTLIDVLTLGESVMLYPSGQLKTQWSEKIIGKKVAYEVLSHLPKGTRVVIARTTGLWGSSSSKAREWKTPSLFLFFLKWLWYLIANIFVFVPKRDVYIELEDITPKLKKKLTKDWSLDTCNERLEHFYNIHGPEKLTYIPYYFYYNHVTNKQLPIIQGSESFMKHVKDYTQVSYSQDVFDAVLKHIYDMKSNQNIQDMTMSTHVVFDLFFDSLDTAELKTYIQSTFPWSSNPPLLDLKLIGDYVMMGMGKSLEEAELKSCDWKQDVSSWFWRDTIEYLTEEESIPSLMKKVFTKEKWKDFCYDTVFGLQTRKDYLIKAYLLARIIKKLPGDYIGIMLPALTGTSLLVIATYLAWKTPVMINRTFWQEAFEHCVQQKNLSVLLTSRSFYQKIKAPYFEKNTLVFFEDILKKVSLKQKLLAVSDAHRFYIPKQKEEAVVLFTSWSEWLPKVVSLSHQNIIQNIKGSLQLVSFKLEDILLGFLPPFHSFGFTITTIFPLITGTRIVYSPDPNDATTLAKLIQHTQVSSITTTPTFFKRILSVATHTHLASLRCVVVWAERCPLEIFDWLKKKAPKATLIEWYGITECSPVISVNPIEKSKKWTVWLPITWLDILVLSLDSPKKPCKIWKEGMVYVSWPSVFSGYIDKNLEDPFILIDKKKFYTTGDLWFLDKDWYLTLTGRLKRFVKIAGEMISLPYIERVLQQKYGLSDEANLAIEGIELPDGKAKIVLFVTPDTVLSLKEVHSYLRDTGVSNLISIAQIVTIKTIPFLWTWKTDYKILKNMILDEK